MFLIKNRFAASVLLLISFQLMQGTLFAQIAGIVRDSVTFKPLSHVNIIVEDMALGTQSDSAGIFRIDRVKPGMHIINFQHVGYELVEKRIDVRKNERKWYDILLSEKPLNTSRIEVEQQRWVRPAERYLLSNYKISKDVILESTGSFEDPMRAIQNYPGMVSHYDYTSGFYTRGNTPEQHAIALDGLMLKNPYRGHIMGFGGLTLINPDIIESLDVAKGGYTTAFGNRMGALVNIHSSDGGTNWENKVAVNVHSARITLSGPVTKKLTNVFSARRTYYDWIIEKVSTDKITYPYFYDFYNKLTWRFLPLHALRITTIFGKEGSKIANLEKYEGSFYAESISLLANISLKGIINNKINYSASAAFQTNSDSMSNQPSVKNHYYSIDYKNTTGSINLDWELFSGSHISTGAEINNLGQNGDLYLNIYNDPVELNDYKSNYKIYSGYLENYLVVKSAFEYKVGIRWDYSELNKQHTESPRLSFRWQFVPSWHFSSSWGIYYQYPEILDSFNREEPLNIASVIKELDAQKSKNITFGISGRLGRNFRLTTEFFSKYLSHLPAEKRDGPLEPGTEPLSYTDTGNARAAGIETSLNYRARRLEWQLGYTYGRSQFRPNSSEEWESLYFEHKHWVNVSSSYRFFQNLYLNTSLKYGSGFPVEYYGGLIRTSSDGWQLVSSGSTDRNPYFRWDMRFSFRKEFWSMYIELINITDTRNYGRQLLSSQELEEEYLLKSYSIYMLPRLPVFGFSLAF